MKMSEKKPSTFDMPCLGLSFAVALCALFYTEPEYPISTTLGYFLAEWYCLDGYVYVRLSYGGV